MTQQALFHDETGLDLGRPLPDEDLEASGFSQEEFCATCACFGACNVILEPGEACADRVPKDLDQETAEILAIEKDLEPAGVDYGAPGPEARRAALDALEQAGSNNAGRQGKCPTCRECYRWSSRRPLSGAYCPACGTKLEGTTYKNAWPWNEGVEPLTAVEAWAKFKRT